MDEHLVTYSTQENEKHVMLVTSRTMLDFEGQFSVLHQGTLDPAVRRVFLIQTFCNFTA